MAISLPQDLASWDEHGVPPEGPWVEDSLYYEDLPKHLDSPCFLDWPDPLEAPDDLRSGGMEPAQHRRERRLDAFASPREHGGSSSSSSDNQSSNVENSSPVSTPPLENGDRPLLGKFAQYSTHFENTQGLFSNKMLVKISDRDFESSRASTKSVLSSMEQLELEISRAPFSKDGGLPVLAYTGDVDTSVPSEITDFGEEILYNNSTEQGASSQEALRLALPMHDARGYLQDQLFAAMQPPHDVSGKRRFLPRGSLARILTVEAVQRELESCLDSLQEKPAIAELAKKICARTKIPDLKGSQQKDGNALPRCKIQSFRKIFAILLLIERPSSIVSFVKEGLNDSDLPLVKVFRSRGAGAFDLRRVHNAKEPLKCFGKSWTQFFIWNFEFWQWATLSPFFGTGNERKEVNHYRFPESTIMPFLKHRDSDQEGGSSRICKVDLHPEHHNFDLTQASNRHFAIKRLRSKDKSTFKKEVEMLKQFSHNAHEHLISVLVTYQLSHTFFLVFPWAEADLRKYWSHINPDPVLNLETVLWVAQQCTGIASGILEIHKYVSSTSNAHPAGVESSSGPIKTVFGHHGDIKPENILWFGTGGDGCGTLRVSDFGLAEVGTHLARRLEPQTMLSPDYRAPETDLGRGNTFGYSSDIWALGCVYLEFATWLLGGQRGVIDFEAKRASPDPYWLGLPTRTFFEVYKDASTAPLQARVKPTVTKFVDEIIGKEACPEFLCDFLDMVQNEMMVIQPTNPRHLGRLCSRQIHYKLEVMLRKCQTNEQYACQPAPKHRRVRRTAVSPDFAGKCAEVCCKQ